jgi:hypothetical protein
MARPETLLAAAWVLTPFLGGVFLLGTAFLTRAEDGPGRIPSLSAVASGLAFGTALLAFLKL